MKKFSRREFIKIFNSIIIIFPTLLSLKVIKRSKNLSFKEAWFYKRIKI